MRLLRLVLAALLCATSPALADKRVALVIGNAAYKNAATLQNPRNDATDVAEALKRAGFETIVGLDLDKFGMDEKSIAFARAVREADVAVFYYSGHAMQFDGFNYLMPVDAALHDEADLRRLTRVDDIVADLKQAKDLRILVLDSCRDNPLAEELSRSLQGNRGFSVDRGLARIIPPSGMIISYATQAGRTAADGRGRNSPYTTAFLKNIQETEEIGAIFRHITADVYTATQGKQLPELSLSLIGDFYLKGGPEPTASAPRVDNAPVPATPASTQTTGEAAQVWGVMQNTTSVAVLEDFIRQFGATPYGSLARARLDELKKQLGIAQEAAGAKAALEAKAAEAKVAERIKAEQEAKAAEAKAAERIKAEQEAKAAEAARTKAEQEARVAAEAARIKAEEAKAAAATEAAKRPQNLAALMPSEQPTKSAALSPGEIVRQLQIELRRVGCFTADVDAEWNANSGHALDLFNKYSGMSLDTKAASLDALDVVRGKSSRVCPVICQRGFHADGERCVETICKAGFTMGDNGTCEALPERTDRTARPELKHAPHVGAQPTTETSKGASGGRVTICDRAGCREAPPGCKPKAASVYGGVVCE
jgi:uncharacterized caspase-like protein